MAIRHLNCGTLCPRGARLLGGDGGLLAEAPVVCHCLLVESSDGLVLIDTGFGTGDARDPARLGRIFNTVLRPRPVDSETAVAKIRGAGLDPADVRHVIATHLDLDHAGGLGDFPEAEVHLTTAEHELAMAPPLRQRQRYIPAHWAHGPRWRTHSGGGDSWFGFESVRVLPGVDPEVALIPLAGHTPGHTGVAVRDPDRWLLHCGDAYFHHTEIETPPRCPPGFRIFEAMMAVDDKQRRRNQGRLRELARDHGEEVETFCSHDPVELDRAGGG